MPLAELMESWKRILTAKLLLSSRIELTKSGRKFSEYKQTKTFSIGLCFLTQKRRDLTINSTELLRLELSDLRVLITIKVFRMLSKIFKSSRNRKLITLEIIMALSLSIRVLLRKTYRLKKINMHLNYSHSRKKQQKPKMMEMYNLSVIYTKILTS